MRTFVVDRKSLQSSELHLPGGEAIQPVAVVAMLDRLGVPDGFPFVTDDDGSPLGCHSINSYQDTRQVIDVEPAMLRRSKPARARTSIWKRCASVTWTAASASSVKARPHPININLLSLFSCS